ncbi:MAG: ferredoxin family protein [Bacteroidales bacterium]|nr:ferredoxin family protein [Bacteroidales bacterium]
MAKIRGAIVVDIEKCKGCGVCIGACPQEVIALSDNVNGKGYHYSYMKNPELCIGCSNCAIVCPDGVITVYRKKMDV